jgi:hypothetical protein
MPSERTQTPIVFEDLLMVLPLPRTVLLADQAARSDSLPKWAFEFIEFATLLPPFQKTSGL